MTDSTPTTAAGWTRNAIQEINSGQLSDAREMLAAALRIDPNYETAWIWFGSIATDDAERRYCFERAVQIDPGSAVADRLARMRTTESHPPPELEDLEAPPLPEEFGGASMEVERPPRAWWPFALMAAVILAGLLGGIWYLWPREERTGSPIYVAFAAGFTGSGAESALQMQRGLQVYIDYVNTHGGVDGHPIEIVSFDDEGDATKAAEVANEIVAQNRFVAVIGHRLSSTSVAAAPIYDAAGLPMISPSATADDLTTTCQWCYRTIFDNKTQGEMMASYLLGILELDQAIVLSEESDYGTSLANGFESAFEDAGGTVENQFSFPTDPEQAGDTIAQAAAEIAQRHPSAVLILAANTELAEQLIFALRDVQFQGTIFGSDAISSRVFIETVAADAAARGEGNVTNDIYAAAPLFVDSLSGDAVRLAEKFLADYGEMPTWRSFTTADAGIAVVNGLRSIGSRLDTLSIEDQRIGIRDRWNQLDAPERAIPAFVGPLYFDANRTASRPVAIGIASGSDYESAPQQLVHLTPRLASATGVETIRVGDREFVVKRVVQTGVNFNVIRDLDTVNETFYADFFVWFKYIGGDDAADITFTNIADPQTLVVEEVRSSDVDGLAYRVYRVTGSFISPLNFRSFPFDTQDLRVRYQNRTLTSAILVYAIDGDFLAIPQAERLTTGGNAAVSINQINNWKPTELDAFAGTVGTTSNLGDPEVSVATEGIQFSQVAVDIGIHRNVGQFLLKNLLPLGLLLAITYISLFFSHDQTTERVSFGITGVLTGAVLLSTVISVLPDVGYTVAIEWAFYGFILLSALCILVALIGGRLNEAKQISEVRTLDLIARIGYPLLVALVVLGYWLVYG